MFRTISRLLFGGEEEVPEDVKPGDMVEEGWHVVTHQEADSAEIQDVPLADAQPSSSALQGNTVANMETEGVLDAEPAGQSSSSSRVVSAALSQPIALTEITQLACIQKSKAWADRHHVSRNAIQRQNRVRQGVQPNYFQLQQPGHRSLGH